MIFDPFKPAKRKRTLTAADKKRIAAKQNWKCKRCGKMLPSRYHADHIKEFSEGGSDSASNIQILCPNCHADKTEEDRHRKRQQKIRQKESKNPFDIDPFSSKKSQSGLFSLGKDPFSNKKPKKKKQKGPFDF